MKKILAVAFCMLVIGAINTRAQNAFISIGVSNETPISNLIINDYIGEIVELVTLPALILLYHQAIT